MIVHRIRPWLAVAWAGVFWSVACSPAEDGGDAPSPVVPTETTQQGIEAFLAAESYRSAPWVGDAAPRDSDDPSNIHGNARAGQTMQVFFNEPAATTAERNDGATEAEPDTMVVKEMYADGVLTGKAVYWKTQAGLGRDSWLFYCSVGSEFSALCAGGSEEATLFGPGLSECGFCHGELPFAPLPR